MQAHNPIPAQSLQLWFTKITAASTTIENETLSRLSESELKKLESMHGAKRRREYLLSRALIRQALGRGFALERDWRIREVAGSAPAIDNLPQKIYTSLSHSAGCIVYAISTAAVGIDLEAIARGRDFRALAGQFMNPDEILALPVGEPELVDQFYRTWCAKEAWYKALPATDQASLSLADLRVTDLIDAPGKWQLIERKIGCYRFAAVVHRRLEKIDYHYWQTSEAGLAQAD